MGAAVGLRHGKSGQVADQPASVTMLDQPGIGLRGGHPFAAGPADHQRRVAAAIEEEQALLAGRQGLGHGRHQRRREPGARFGRLFAQVDQLDARQDRAPAPRGELQPPIAPGLGVPERLQRRRGRGQHHQGVLDLGPRHGQIAGLVDEPVLLLERAVVFLVDDDQLQPRIGQKERRARAHYDAAAPLGHRLPGRRGARGRLDRRMPLGRPGPKPLLEAVDHRLGERNLGQKDQHLGLGVGGEHGGDRLQIDLRLARARDTVEQRGLKSPLGDEALKRVRRRRLARIERSRGPARVGRVEREDRLDQANLQRAGEHKRADHGRTGARRRHKRAERHGLDRRRQHTRPGRRHPARRQAGAGDEALGPRLWSARAA